MNLLNYYFLCVRNPGVTPELTLASDGNRRRDTPPAVCMWSSRIRILNRNANPNQNFDSDSDSYSVETPHRSVVPHGYMRQFISVIIIIFFLPGKVAFEIRLQTRKCISIQIMFILSYLIVVLNYNLVLVIIYFSILIIHIHTAKFWV